MTVCLVQKLGGKTLSPVGRVGSNSINISQFSACVLTVKPIEGAENLPILRMIPAAVRRVGNLKESVKKGIRVIKDSFP